MIISEEVEAVDMEKSNFEDLQAENVIGNLSDEVMQLCNEILSEEK